MGVSRWRVASLVACLALALAACSSGTGAAQESTSGAAFSPPSAVETTTFQPQGAVEANDGAIDVSHLAQGQVARPRPPARPASSSW